MTDEAYHLFLSQVKIWEVAISALIPLSVIIIGLFVNERVKRLEAEIQRSQTLINKRIGIFEQLRAPLNQVFCACYYVGEWRTIPPPAVLESKRKCDEILFSQIPFWSKDVLVGYKSFFDVCFHTYRGKGLHAALRSDIDNFIVGFGERWDESWRPLFMNKDDRNAWLAGFKKEGKSITGLSYSQDIVLPRYASLMEAFSHDLASEASSEAIKDTLARKAATEAKA